MEKASDKQISYALKLGIPNPDQFSKQALRELISSKTGQPLSQQATITTINPQIEQKSQPQASNKEYHLTDEQIRSNALESALSFNMNESMSTEGLIVLAKVFEKYIRGE